MGFCPILVVLVLLVVHEECLLGGLKDDCNGDLDIFVSGIQMTSVMTVMEMYLFLATQRIHQ